MEIIKMQLEGSCLSLFWIFGDKSGLRYVYFRIIDINHRYNESMHLVFSLQFVSRPYENIDLKRDHSSSAMRVRDYYYSGRAGSWNMRSPLHSTSCGSW